MNALIFGFGFVVTLMVVAALGILIWGAVLDGRPAESDLTPAGPTVIPLSRKGDAA